MLSAIFTANARVETFFLYIFLPRFIFQVVHKLKGEPSTGTQSHIGRCTKEVKIEHLSFFFFPFLLSSSVPKESWCRTWT